MTLDQFLKDVSTDLALVQYDVLKDIIFNNDSMTILPRAGGKTFLLALAALWWAKCNKSQRICMTTAVYRQTKWMVEEVQRWVKRPAVFENNFCRITFDNGSTIMGLQIKDVVGKEFDYILVDEYQWIRSDLRDYIDGCDVGRVSIMISDDIENSGFMDLIVNRKRCYKLLKYSTSDYPKGYYDEEILRELAELRGT